MLGNAYPSYYELDTDWGTVKFKNGDRWANPLDSWPDPFTYIHYPSNVALTYQDIRNVNRCYPGRPDGSLIERVCYAIMEIIRNEGVDIAIDAHEAAVMYPVVETYVAHDRALDIAMMASMSLSAEKFYMKCEASPKNLRGLSHREWGDFSDTLAVLMETPQTFTDWIVGPMTKELQTIGSDEFLDVASKKGPDLRGLQRRFRHADRVPRRPSSRRREGTHQLGEHDAHGSGEGSAGYLARLRRPDGQEVRLLPQEPGDRGFQAGV